jgi:hypothetical protein
MQTLINTIHGVAVATGMFFLDVPNFLLWGLFSAVLRFIPYVGPWIAAAIPILLSLAVFDNWTTPLMVIGYFVFLELLSNNLLEPWLYGSSAGVSPLAVIVTAIFWTWLWGPIGLLLATPLTVCIVVMGKYIPALHFINILLGDEPVLEPHFRFYQRLLAMDQEEAFEVAENFLKETGSVIAVYDKVIIPGMGLAEMDRHEGNLEEHRVQFIHVALRQMIEDLGELEVKAREKNERKDRKEKSDEPETAMPPLPELPQVSPDLYVLCLPARDEADQIVAEMLAQVLRVAGARSDAISVTALSSEMGDLVPQRRAGLVCISALPPSAATQARYLCKRIGARFPELPIVVGLWNAKGDLERARERVGCGEAVRVVTSLADAVATIDGVVRTRRATATGPEQAEPRQVAGA